MSDPAPSTELDAVRQAAGRVVERFGAAGHRLYLVGGIVRDHHLGRLHDTNDLDATTDARPEEIKAIVAPLAEAVWSQGERFGTIGCVIDGRTWEITTHRAEAYDERSRKPAVTFGDRIDDDLARRDFTVNAMAIDLADGSIVDPHGGAADLAAGVLRTPLDPEVSFSEDPLRMLRAARFHAGYGLRPQPALVDAITAMVDRMAIVSAERIRDELQKLILLDAPLDGLRLLADTGLMAAVLPPFRGEVEPVGRRLAAVPGDAAMRWAALLLDSGVEPADLRALVFSGRLMADTLWFASSPLLTEAAPTEPTAGAVRRAAAIAPGDRRLEEQLEFADGVRAAHGLAPAPVDAWRRVLGRLRAAEPDLDDPAPVLGGNEISAALGIDPGPDIGVAQRWLRDLRFDEGPLDPALAAARLRDWWASRSQTPS